MQVTETADMLFAPQHRLYLRMASRTLCTFDFWGKREFSQNMENASVIGVIRISRSGPTPQDWWLKTYSIVVMVF